VQQEEAEIFSGQMELYITPSTAVSLQQPGIPPSVLLILGHLGHVCGFWFDPVSLIT